MAEWEVGQVAGARGRAATARARLHAQLDPAARRSGVSLLNRVLIFLILASTALGVLATEPAVVGGRERMFGLIDLGLGLVFLAEYAARVWVAPEGGGHQSAAGARLRFVVSPAALLDLVVIVAALLPSAGAGPAVLRLVRAARILRLAKLGRASRALGHLAGALRSRRDELGVTAALAAGVVVLSASALYWAEGDVQPEQFGSIPRSMWWAVVTLTTIGYGDVYPVTAVGRLLATVVAVAGIALVAMPTGILAAAFSDAMSRDRARGGAEADEKAS